MDAREVALLTLSACEHQGGWSDGALKKQLAMAGLDARDAGLATNLCFGVLQNRMLLDFYLGHFSNLPIKRMESRVIQALRLGAYQMLFLDKIPHSAAVDRSVEMTRTHCKNTRAPGMVNGILRSLQRNLDHLPIIPNQDKIEYLSTLYSNPSWLVKEFISVLGEEGAQAVMSANNQQPPMTAMVNTVKISATELVERLTAEGVRVEAHSWLADCLVLYGTGNLEELESFKDGLFYIQDCASRLAILAANPAPNSRVLDVCAAPGGKSFAAGIAMGNSGEIISCDLHPHKKKLIQNGADRLGLTNIVPTTADGKVFREEWAEGFDTVIVDAPCSGLGVIRKKPDIRYKNPDELRALPEIQRDILNNASKYVKSGGVLLYSTCTVLQRENNQIVEEFLRSNSAFKAEAFTLPEPVGAVDDGIVGLWPHLHDTDGFFICKLRKE